MINILWESTYRETRDPYLNVPALRKNGSINNLIVLSICKIDLNQPTPYYRVDIPGAPAIFSDDEMEAMERAEVYINSHPFLVASLKV